MAGSVASLGPEDDADCIGEDELLRYVGGALTERRMADVREHVDTCEECRMLLAIVGKEVAGGPGGGTGPMADAMSGPMSGDSLDVGYVIEGRFVIEGEIGRGGMGVVYAAKHLAMNRPVALKVIGEELTKDDDAVRRFLRESRVAATLQSPHIAKVLDVGRLASGAPYMVMERLSGKNLEVTIREDGPLDIGLAVLYISQACEALGEAHSASVVHRDVKLENLFLSTDGAEPSVKVLDFGLATKGHMIADASITRSHAMMGTPRYMSPEQIGSARDVDARSDVWALGVCLFRLVTAKYPYDAPHLGALCMKIATAKPTRPSSWRADLPIALEEVILRCLKREPEERYADAHQLGAALASVLATRRLVVPAIDLGATRPQRNAPEPQAAITGDEHLASTQIPAAAERERKDLAVGHTRVGAVLAGKYRVERVLGIGGMGMVVAVTHLQLGERYALKFLMPDLANEPETVARFMREAQAAARLKSEHIARVNDVGQLPNGPPYFVMEHLVGQDLAKRLRATGPLSVPEAVDIVLQACAAIAEAHSLGIIHRDLKPSNLFMSQRPDGSLLVKVLDFGISKAAADIEDPSLTTTREVIGSPAYMSPEQIRSARNVDTRADIWALGIILHELLTGSLPFEGATASALLAAAAADAPKSARAVRADVSVELDAAIRCCLEKNPENRFPSVAELALAIEPYGSGMNTSLVRRFARGATSSRGGTWSGSSPALVRQSVPPPAPSAAVVVTAPKKPVALVLALLAAGILVLGGAAVAGRKLLVTASSRAQPAVTSAVTASAEPPKPSESIAPPVSVEAPVAAAPSASASARPRAIPPKRPPRTPAPPATAPTPTATASSDPTSTSH